MNIENEKIETLKETMQYFKDTIIPSVKGTVWEDPMLIAYECIEREVQTWEQ